MSADRWWVKKDQAVFGPYQTDELRAHIAQGAFTPVDMVSTDGTTGWAPLWHWNDSNPDAKAVPDVPLTDLFASENVQKREEPMSYSSQGPSPYQPPSLFDPPPPPLPPPPPAGPVTAAVVIGGLVWFGVVLAVAEQSAGLGNLISLFTAGLAAVLVSPRVGAQNVRLNVLRTSTWSFLRLSANLSLLLQPSMLRASTWSFMNPGWSFGVLAVTFAASIGGTLIGQRQDALPAERSASSDSLARQIPADVLAAPVAPSDVFQPLVPVQIPGFEVLSYWREPMPMQLPRTGVRALYRATDGSSLRLDMVIQQNAEPLTASGRTRRISVHGHPALQSEREGDDQVWVGWRNGPWVTWLWITWPGSAEIRTARRQAPVIAQAVAEWSDPQIAGTLSTEEQNHRRILLQNVPYRSGFQVP